MTAVPLRLRLVQLSEGVRASYWFVPTLMALGAVALAYGMIVLDQRVARSFVERVGWVYSGGPEGARGVLSTVAGSVMSTAGVVFSITIAALSLASSQLGPRLLRGFMRDRGNQVVLGTFIATFVYCLLVLRTVRGADEGARFVPHLSVTVGVGLGLASLGVLIYFIHHVAISIQAPQVVATVAGELNRQIDRLFPERGAEPGPREDDALPPRFEEDAAVVEAGGDGYLQAVDLDRLVALAEARDVVIRLEERVGGFVARGAPFARVYPPERLDARAAARIRALGVLGAQRTEQQDVEFAVHQLVEVAVRTLSPAINDPYTAMSCLDRLGAGLCRMARRAAPSGRCRDASGRMRVLVRNPVTFAGAVDAAFHGIRQYGRGSAPVLLRLLETIATVLACAEHEDQRQVLLRHAEMARRAGLESLPEAADRADVEARYRHVLGALGESREAAGGAPEHVAGAVE